MAYEKADFYAAYRDYAVDEATGRRFSKYRDPNLFDGAVMTLIVHYHPLNIKKDAAYKAQRLVDHFAATASPLTSTSCVVVIGGAFGWTGEALEDLVPGLEAVSCDTSNWVQDAKAQSANDELQEQLEAQGYSITEGPGQYMYDLFKSDEPRSRNPQRVLQNDMSTNKLRNDLRRTFQRNEVTHVVTEEVWQILTQEEQDRYSAAAADYGAVMAHIIDNVII